MFSFNGVHAKELGVRVRSLQRELKPRKRVTQTVIGGRDGSYDFTDNTYANTSITFECSFIGVDVETFKNKVALWIAGEGLLTIDTDKTKHYEANLYSSVPLNQMIYAHEFTLTFECKPFAVSDTRQITEIFSDGGHSVPVHSDGTHDSPCIIIIKNIGTTSITDIVITRKANIL